MSAQLPAVSIAPWGRAVAGATGAVLANAAVYPLDIVKTRMQVQSRVCPEGADHHEDRPYSSTWDAINRIVAADGISGLYAGLNGSLLGVASTNFAYFYWYSVVRSVYQQSHQRPVPPSMTVELALGAVAGAIAQLCTIPVAVVTTRQQTQCRTERKNLLETTKDVIHGDDGVLGLWRGLKASLVLVANPAVTYGVYERLKQSLWPDKAILHPWQAFVLGALSKSIATVLTQPLIVAKVGLQSKPPRARGDKPFRNFVEVMQFIVEREGLAGLFKGLAPQILKGILVQGILMMAKERIEILFALLFRFGKGLQLPKIKGLPLLPTIRQTTSHILAIFASNRLTSS